MDYMMYVQLVEQRITILFGSVSAFSHVRIALNATFETDAVKTTTSYSSPTRFMNWSTPGLLIT